MKKPILDISNTSQISNTHQFNDYHVHKLQTLMIQNMLNG